MSDGIAVTQPPPPDDASGVVFAWDDGGTSTGIGPRDERGNVEPDGEVGLNAETLATFA